MPLAWQSIIFANIGTVCDVTAALSLQMMIGFAIGVIVTLGAAVIAGGGRALGGASAPGRVGLWAGACINLLIAIAVYQAVSML